MHGKECLRNQNHLWTPRNRSWDFKGRSGAFERTELKCADLCTCTCTALEAPSRYRIQGKVVTHQHTSAVWGADTPPAAWRTFTSLCVAVAQNKTHCSLLCSYAKHIICALRNVYGKANFLPLEQFFPGSQSVNTVVLSGVISDVQPECIICIGTATRNKKERKKESTTMHKPLCF